MAARKRPFVQGWAQTTAHVVLEIASGRVTSAITNEAVDELKLRKGQAAYSVIKASDVMVATD